MTKQEHIAYWVRTAEEDWTVVDILFEKGKYLYCLFYAHLAVEKILKANWVKNSDENYPPKIHNLVTLAKQSNIELESDNMKLLPIMNDFQIQGRYPEYKDSIANFLTKDYVSNLLPKAKELYKCLKEML